MALAAISQDRRALLVTGEESTAQVKLRAERLGGAERVEILAETELETVCETLRAERPDVCVIDSVQTLYSAELGSAPGSVGAGAGGGRAAAPGGEGVRCRHRARRPRDEGRLGRRPARARAPRRLRAPVRGRPLPRPPRAAGGEEPFRLDERARRLRDDRRRPRRRPRPLRDLRAHRRGRARRRRRVRARGDAADPARGAGARRADRPRDAAPGGDRRRPEAARDDRRRARPPRRHPARAGRRVRQRRRRRPHRRAGRRPRGRARDRLRRAPAAGPRAAPPPSARSASPAGCGRPRRPTGGSRSAPSSGSSASSLRPAPRRVAHCGWRRRRRSARRFARASTLPSAMPEKETTETSRPERALADLGFTRTPSEDPRRNPELLEAIAKVAPGSELRQAVDDVIRSHEGALIVVGDPSRARRSSTRAASASTRPSVRSSCTSSRRWTARSSSTPPSSGSPGRTCS